jgi:hypothetical protein
LMGAANRMIVCGSFVFTIAAAPSLHSGHFTLSIAKSNF